jgi:hypothetical protein
MVNRQRATAKNKNVDQMYNGKSKIFGLVETPSLIKSPDH